MEFATLKCMVLPELNEHDFDKIRRLIYEKCGINLHEGKKELVSTRLHKRLLQGNFRSFGDYYRYVVTDEGTEELVRMIDSLSTNLTYFFREGDHFQKFSSLLPMLMENALQRGAAKLLIWSAGCSTGEEPYSLAMTIREGFPNSPLSAKILATDVSTHVLKAAVQGIYSEDKKKDIPVGLVHKYFQQGTGKWEGYCRVKRQIREMVHFRRFNLMDTPPPYVFFDVIFCRNVMIYFDKPTQEGVVSRLYNNLVKGGYLFIGHSESLTGLRHHFKYIEPSVYRK